ncbi:hypothetical protein DAPPUDRAFT_111169 [Daphnia pulex]|uniref:Uncharacterized protein n=1 Tax=Daphnia pulex TaxID=6669 RepID=E9H8E3_DAPPU|nr:hypothetical protein DAPPUDRAFT_111169 [Daphnia pulex]|eukprot:EFX72000.1 hypothetical protein DAPPUDRAFT_111169 [Daphnia pulex]
MGLNKLCIKAQQHLPLVHLDLFVVALQLGSEEHLPPVHLDLFVVAVQLGDEEHQTPVHLDLFVVAVQLGDKEHKPPVQLNLFGVLRLLFEPVDFHHPANGPTYVVDEVQMLPAKNFLTTTNDQTIPPCTQQKSSVAKTQ